MMGQQLVWFLAKHKNTGLLGLQMLKSVTIFAADSVRTMSHSEGGRRTELVKWPVVIWEITPHNTELMASVKKTHSLYINPDNTHLRGPNGNWAFPNIPCPQLAAKYSNFFPRVELPLADITYTAQTPGNAVIDETIIIQEAPRDPKLASTVIAEDRIATQP